MEENKNAPTPQARNNKKIVLSPMDVVIKNLKEKYSYLTPFIPKSFSLLKLN